MPRTKPLLVIVIAVLFAGGVAVYLSRDRSTSESAGDTALTPAASSGPVHVRGRADAPVTLMEFGDYQCPSCGYYHPIVTEVLRRYPEKVKFEFHHFPLIQIHANAMPAALAAEAAGEQGKFWEMHDLLFEHQNDWSRNPNPEAAFIAMAIQLGLNSNQFQQAMKSPQARDKILADVTRGRDANIEGTPTFFVNGRMVDNLASVDEFARVIDSQLQPVAP